MFSASRGAEGIENLQKGFDVHWNNLKEYFEIVNAQLFGGGFWLLAVISLIVLIYGWVKNKECYRISEHIWELCVLVLPTMGYIAIVAKVAPYNTDRYIMATFAMIILIVLLGLNWIFENCIQIKKVAKNCILGAVCATLLLSIWKDFQKSSLILVKQSK